MHWRGRGTLFWNYSQGGGQAQFEVELHSVHGEGGGEPQFPLNTGGMPDPTQAHELLDFFQTPNPTDRTASSRLPPQSDPPPGIIMA